MGKNEKTPIVINDIEYFYEDMEPQQQAMVNHIRDLERKIGSTQFNLDQLNVGKQAFTDMLIASLTPQSEEVVEDVA